MFISLPTSLKLSNFCYFSYPVEFDMFHLTKPPSPQYTVYPQCCTQC